MWMILLGLACQPSDSPWAETTSGPSLDCGDCEVVHDGDMEHFGDVLVVVDRQVDDPHAQWTACMVGLLDCLESGGDPLDCVDEAECPKDCAKAMRKAARSSDGRQAELDAIESVMFDGGECELPGSVEVTP